MVNNDFNTPTTNNTQPSIDGTMDTMSGLDNLFGFGTAELGATPFGDAKPNSNGVALARGSSFPMALPTPGFAPPASELRAMEPFMTKAAQAHYFPHGLSG